MTPEGKVKAYVSKGIKVLATKYHGKIAYRMPVLRGMGRPMLDYIGSASGRSWMIETKRDEKHKLTPQQDATRREWFTAGTVIWVVYDTQSADTALAELEALVINPWCLP